MKHAPKPLQLLMLCSAMLAVRGASIRAASAVDVAAYEAFRSHYGRSEEQGSSDYQQRLAFFIQRKAEVDAQNAKVNKTWWAKVNKFADMTDLEYRSLLGYRRVIGPGSSKGIIRGSSFLQMDAIAESRDWRKLNSSGFLRVQGGCGSCWAVAATGALEMHAEIHQNQKQKLSFSQLLDCTPNPAHCGGDGGCSGATAELAFEFAQQHGIASEADYQDSEADGKCVATKAALQPKGFVKLPENQLSPLSLAQITFGAIWCSFNARLAAVSEKGPVVVSVDAGQWTIYDGGVFNSCKQDATINHAVLLVGYGEDKGEKYWVIRNSWGADWGENGYMRLLRHDGDEAKGGQGGFCGTDYDPKVGVGCQGGPPSLPVCGMCGVLSDSSYPKI